MSFASTTARVVEETSTYWRAVFDHPPINVVDSDVPRETPMSRTSSELMSLRCRIPCMGAKSGSDASAFAGTCLCRDDGGHE